jgi:predicted nucleotidyltransferase
MRDVSKRRNCFMSESKLDLSTRGELTELAELVVELARLAPAYEPLLIGARARDILLEYAWRIPVYRETEDLDFAFSVADWPAYERLIESLLTSGDFSRDSHKQHRLIFRGSRKIDFIPFGGVERADRTIAWPPDGGTVMVGRRQRQISSFFPLPSGSFSAKRAIE